MVSAKKVLDEDFEGILREKQYEKFGDEYLCTGHILTLSAWWKEK